MNCLQELLSERGVLMVDGAMGTRLFATDLEAGDAPERMNLDQPDAIVAVHRRYIDAGSDIVLTNSFGGTSFRLKLHKLDNQVVEINAAAARHGRAAADSVDRKVLVAGSMGPSGELLEPMGALTMDAARLAFGEQAKGLAEGGADLLWIETMSSLEEVEAAIQGARSATDLPIVATFSFDTAGRTMMGVRGVDVVERLAQYDLAAVGANCGNNLADTEAAVAQMRAAAPDMLIVSKANAGIPQWVGAELHYSGSPEIMGAHADRLRNAGINIIGGCCGSGPEHIAHMRGVLDGVLPVPDVDFVAAVESAAGDPDRSTRRRRRA
jgi:methionine synthase I (cobalamin-dependent)